MSGVVIITGSKQIISKIGVKQKHIIFKHGGKCQKKINERVLNEEEKDEDRQKQGAAGQARGITVCVVCSVKTIFVLC